MNETDPATAVGADARDTEVGSVFVSNYPPYSFWRQDAVPAALKTLAAPPAADVDLGLYTHIPFCRKRCKFCYFRVYTDKNAADVQTYVDAVLKETDIQAGQRAIRDRPVRFVYFGGGTPSYISARHLGALVAGLRASLPWDAVREFTFECEPGTLTRTKLEAIRRIGVTRLSLGVENFVDEILEENGRAHLSNEIYRVLPWIRDLDFEQLNIDLIAGMVGEDWASWKENVRRAIDVDPDSVTIYQMELPFNTVYSRRLLEGKPVPVADWATKREWQAYAIDELSAAGYEISSAYTMVKGGRDGGFNYRDALWHGADLLGVGVSSFSHINGIHYQNVSRWEGYLERVAAGELPIDRAYATTDRERMTRELILQMKLGRLDPAYFADKFGVNILETFTEPIRALEERGFLSVVDGALRLSREGLLRVDTLLPEFYESIHQNTRYT